MLQTNMRQTNVRQSMLRQTMLRQTTLRQTMMRYTMTAGLAATIGVAGSAAYFSPWFWRRYRMNRIRRELAKNRVLALTYDDGPSDGLTPQILDLLQRHNARGTFFMLGRSAQRHPQIADRVVE